MKTFSWLTLVLSLGASWALSADTPSVVGEEVVLDAPGGHPIAILLAGAHRTNGDVRDGFVRVTLEGWIRLPADAAPASPLEAPPVGVGTEPALTAPALSGNVTTLLPSGEIHFGAGARIVLLGQCEDLEAQRLSLESRYRIEQEDLKKEGEALALEQQRALNSSDNLHEATQRLDRSKATLAARKRKSEKLLETYREKLEDLFRRHQVAETTADARGWYRFPKLSPGSYRLLAVSTVGESVHRWYVPVGMPATGGVQLDLSESSTGTDPYLGLR